MAEQRNNGNIFAEVRAKYSKVKAAEQERLYLQEMLTKSKEMVDSIFQRVNDLPAKLDAERNSMINAKEMMEFLKQNSAAMLNDVKKKNVETAQKQASLLNAQEGKYKRKVSALVAIQKECECLQNALEQKKVTVDGLEKESSEETLLFARQRSTLSNLLSRHGLKRVNSSFVEEHRALQSDTAKITEIFGAGRDEIENLLKENSAIAQALAAAETENSLKSIELATLQFQTAAMKEMCQREKNNQLKIMSEYQTTVDQQKTEISQLEQQFAGRRAAYKNVQKMNADLNERVTSEFGNSKRLEEMKEEAEKELAAFQAECSQLTESVDGINKLIHLNETELQKLLEAQLFEPLGRSYIVTKPLTSDQGNQMLEEEVLRQMQESVVDVSMLVSSQRRSSACEVSQQHEAEMKMEL